MPEDPVLPPEVHDDALARLLGVAPLDELTRRRLVSEAVAAADAPEDHEHVDDARSGPPVARSRLVAVVAAAVAFVVLGVAAVTLPGSDTTDLAGRAARPHPNGSLAPLTTSTAPSTPAAVAAGAGFAGAGPAGASGLAGLPDLGSLGDVGGPGSAKRVADAALPVVAGVRPEQRTVRFERCPPRTLRVVASGRGTIAGDPVEVVVSLRDDGSLQVRALDGTTCRLRSLR